MIWWLIKSRNISCAGTRGTWFQMLEDGVSILISFSYFHCLKFINNHIYFLNFQYLPHRTMRSLYNHYIRKIRPNLHEFSLPQEIIEKFNKAKPGKR